MDKKQFVQYGFSAFAKGLAANASGNWGKMNAQQMVEHVTAFFKLSSGKLIMPVLTPEEQLPKLKAFILSDKEFRENTKAPKEVIGDDPLPLRNETMEAAIYKLEKSIEAFFQYFSNGDETQRASHPVFGSLNFEEWIQLNYKHVLHHAKQFGYVTEA